MARKMGFDNINMDLIAGLPEETVDMFKYSLDEVIKLDPENITVHSMCVKRAASLRFSDAELAKANDKAYAAYVKKINKKNTKMEAKCAKKGKPFEPIPVPEKDEVVLQTNKKRKVWRMIIRILLIWLIVYFIIMWLMYSPAILPTEAEDTTAAASYDYEPYSNPHEITTTPDYTIAEAKVFLKQVIHDNWKNIGYSSDVSNDAITYNNKTIVVNNANCYVFSCAGKTYAIPIKLSGCYVLDNGEYKPLTFDNTNYLF